MVQVQCLGLEETGLDLVLFWVWQNNRVLVHPSSIKIIGLFRVLDQGLARIIIFLLVVFDYFVKFLVFNNQTLNPKNPDVSSWGFRFRVRVHPSFIKIVGVFQMWLGPPFLKLDNDIPKGFQQNS